MKTITWFLDRYLFCRKSYLSKNSWIYSFKKLIKMMQCMSSFQLSLCHSLNTVSSKAFAVRKILTRGGEPEVASGSSIMIPFHLPWFRMLSTLLLRSPSLCSGLLRSFTKYSKSTNICSFSVASTNYCTWKRQNYPQSILGKVWPGFT